MKNNKHCERCGCLWDDHPNGAIDNETFKIIRIMVDNGLNGTGACKCKRFRPMDNLQFLEWLNERSTS